MTANATVIAPLRERGIPAHPKMTQRGDNELINWNNPVNQTAYPRHTEDYTQSLAGRPGESSR
jgi:hypothetical protein